VPHDTAPSVTVAVKPFRRSSKRRSPFIVALAEAAEAASLALAGHLAVQLGLQVGGALTRCSRLLRNARIEDQPLTAQLLRVVYSERELLAPDWTEWRHGLRMLMAAVVGRRAIPMQAAAFSKAQIPRSQYPRETAFLHVLGHTLRTPDQASVVICDRGFCHVSWLRHCQDLRQALVVCLVAEVMVDTGTQGRRLRRAAPAARPGYRSERGPAPPGQGRARRRRRGWAPGQATPWWLATDLPDRLADIVAWYDRRMTVEEQSRDTYPGLFLWHIACMPDEGCYRPAGLTRRIDEILLSLMPLSVTFGYRPGSNFAMLVPVKSSSSKNSQVPDRMTIEEMLFSHFPNRFMSPTIWV
jgi:hypothetical protein